MLIGALAVALFGATLVASAAAWRIRNASSPSVAASRTTSSI